MTDSAAKATVTWLTKFDAALSRGAAAEAAALFLSDGQWRDILAFTWDMVSLTGRGKIEALLKETLACTKPKNFRLDPARTAPRWVARGGTETVEAFVSFDTAAGSGSGVLRLVVDPTRGEPRAWTFATFLMELAGYPESIGVHRPTGPSGLRDFGAENWLDQRRKALEYTDRDPTVLVVGAGQAGLSIAARLGVFGIDTLIVDRNARVGDNWRNRYHSLTLHNEVFVNDFPYLPFPPSWPTYISKDKLAHWLEFYADAMELNCWMSTEFVSGRYEDKAERWNIDVRRADGTVRTLRPRHLVLAVGASPISHMPKLPGLDSFGGTIMHSERYTTGTPWRGRKALVLGTGTSGHDVTQDLTACGAHVTMIQRSPTYVVSLKEAQRVYTTYTLGLPVEECDLLGTSYPYDSLLQMYQAATAESTHADRKMLDDLIAAGFRMDIHEKDCGFQQRYYERGGGYYFNVGCSNLIIDRKVNLLQYGDVDQFVPEGVRLRNGKIVPADLLVLATGYLSQQEVARRLLGDAVADRIGPVWGFDENGELRNMWKRTPQKGLWFHAGSLPQCRIFSRFLALQIKAIEEGLLPLAMPTGSLFAARSKAVSHLYQVERA